MPCAPAPFNGFICTRGPRRSCKAPGCGKAMAFLCDWPLHGAAAGKTCSFPMCPTHAHQVGPDVHYCPAHGARDRADKAAGAKVQAAALPAPGPAQSAPPSPDQLTLQLLPPPAKKGSP